MTARIAQKGFSPIAIVIGLAALLLVIGGLYLLGGEEEVAKKSGTVAKSQAPAVTPEGTQVTKAVTTDIKTYNNAKYKVSFQYPGNWTVEEAENGFLSVHAANKAVTSDGPQCPDGFAGIELQIGHQKSATENFDAFVTAQVTDKPEGLSPGGKLEKFLINGKNTYKVEHAGWDSNCKGPGYFIEQNPTTFTYIFTGVGANSEAAVTQLLTQIVNSIRYQ